MNTLELYNLLSKQIFDCFCLLEFINEYIDNNDIDSLNNSSAIFFSKTTDSWFSNIFITLGKILDPKEYKGYDNLSLDRLISESELISSQKEILCKELEKIKINSKKINNIRNKFFAHNDKNFIKSLDETGFVDIKEIEKCIEEIKNFMELFHKTINNNQFNNIFLCRPDSGFNDVISLLKDGLELRKRNESINIIDFK